MRSIQRHSGFTLIELMIAVAVIGILAAIAFPAYTEYLVKSNRAAAKSFMLNVSSREEEYMLDARQYAGIADHAGFSTLSLTVPQEVSDYYTVTVSAPGRTYTIQAVPKAGTRQANDGTLTLDNTGAKAPPNKW